MKKRKDFFSVLLVICIGILLLVMRNAVADEVKNGLDVCGKVLIPSLFPFMMLSSFAVKSGVFAGVGKIVSPLMKKVFRLPGLCFPVLLFGFTGGYPVGMNIVSELYENGRISKDDARHMMVFCVNAGPAFIITAVGEMLLGSKTAGIVILVAVCLSSVITGVIYSFFRKKSDVADTDICSEFSLSQSIVNAVCLSSKSMLSVCSWVLIFSAFSGIVVSFISDEKILNVYRSFAEVTTGISSAGKSGGLPFVSAVISFGGICVMCQLLPAIKKCGIKVSEYLGFRTVNAVLAFVITKIILLFVDIPIEVSAVAGSYLWSYSAPASAMLLIMSAVLIFDIASGQTGKIKLWDITG